MSTTPKQRAIVSRHHSRRSFMSDALRALGPGGSYDAIRPARALHHLGEQRQLLYSRLLDEEHPPEEASSRAPSPSSFAGHHARTTPQGLPHERAAVLRGALRALTPDGTLADLHVGRSCFWPRTAFGMHMWMLLQDERPDLRPWARVWNARAHERLIIPEAFIQVLGDPSKRDHPEPLRHISNRFHSVLSSKIFYQATRAGRYDLMFDTLSVLVDLADGSHADRHYFPLMRYIRSAVLDGLGLPFALKRLPRPLRTPDAHDAAKLATTTSWRRVAVSYIDPVRADVLELLDRLTRALEAREGVDDPTTLVVGLELYCAGFVDHGARIWRLRPSS